MKKKTFPVLAGVFVVIAFGAIGVINSGMMPSGKTDDHVHAHSETQALEEQKPATDQATTRDQMKDQLNSATGKPTPSLANTGPDTGPKTAPTPNLPSPSPGRPGASAAPSRPKVDPNAVSSQWYDDEAATR